MKKIYLSSLFLTACLLFAWAGTTITEWTSKAETTNVTQAKTDSESISTAINWLFDLGTSNQTATYTESDTKDYFGQEYVTIGSNLAYFKDVKSKNGINYTAFQPVSKSGSATDQDYISFVVKPKSGMTFSLTNIKFDCMRFGTGGGKIHVKWKSSDGTITTIASDVIPGRDSETSSGPGTHYDASSFDFSSIPASDGECMLMLQLYSLDNNKQVGFSNIRIEGRLTGSATQVTMYDLEVGILPESAGKITTFPHGTEFEEGTEVTLTATRNFSYSFAKWVDGDGNLLSTENPYTITMDANKTVKAEFLTLNTYSLNLNVGGGANNYLVTITPQGNVVDGVSYYEEGTQIKATATSNKIVTFTNWEDNSTESERSFTIDRDTDLTAHYSARDFIVGWDFYLDDPKMQRAADYFSESENRGMFSVRKADATTSSWLAKGMTAGQSEGRYCVVNWNALADKYYYEVSFSTVNYTNVKVSAAMLYNYNVYKEQKVEYSVDGNTFSEVGRFVFEANKTWYENEFNIPEEAWGKEKIFVRFIPDYTSQIVGSSSEKDGTTITNVFVTAENNEEPVVTPPVLLSSIPANDLDGVSATGSIILTFDRSVVAGTGSADLNDEVLNATFSGKTVVFNYSGLTYNTKYTFTVPSGMIVDRWGNRYEGCQISFTTMERTQPTARLFDAIVAADGSGNYTTVSAAIEAAPTGNIAPYLIFIKEGKYKEHILIPETKPYIYLIGQDVDKVIITDDQLCGGDQAVTGKPALHVSEGASVVVQAANFFAENISFENSWGIEKNDGPQALALFTNNDRVVLSNCKLRSYQDTYLTSTKKLTDRHYLKNCFIEGAVDFIYGGGDAFFDECTINIVRKSGGYIVAPSHKEGTSWGYVFMNNTITAPAPAIETSVWLGRPWQNAPKTAFINTTSEITIPAAGWYYKMGAIPHTFADYNTMDASGNPIDLSNRIEDYEYEKDGQTVKGKAKKALTAEEVAQYTIKNVLTGTDNWMPQLITEKTANAQVQLSANNTLTWGKVDYAICYVVYQDGKVVDFTADTQYVTSLGSNQVAHFAIQAVSESGALSGLSNTVEVNGNSSSLSDNATSSIEHYTKDGYLYINNLPTDASVSVYNLTGVQLFSQRGIEGGEIRISIDQPGIVKIISRQETVSFKVLK